MENYLVFRFTIIKAEILFFLKRIKYKTIDLSGFKLMKRTIISQFKEIFTPGMVKILYLNM